MYEILMENGIDVPHHVVVNREGDGDGRLYVVTSCVWSKVDIQRSIKER